MLAISIDQFYYWPLKSNLKSGSECRVIKSVGIYLLWPVVWLTYSSWSTDKKSKLPNIHFPNSQSPARSSKSQLDQTIILHNTSKSKKMHQLHILHYEFAQNELKVWYKSLLRLSGWISILSSNSYQTSEKLRLISIRIPPQASRHSDKKSQTHEPGRIGCPFIPDEFRGLPSI